jgi:transcription antitermination factor NusG
MPNWFALRVRPKHEKTVATHLSRLGLDEYVPLQKVRRQWSDRLKELDAPLFPGYLFCRFAYSDRMRVLSVASVVGAVDDSEIEAVRSLVRSGKPLAHLPFLRIGQHVLIEHGPLAGIRGVVLRDESAWRVVVSVEALDRSIAVEVDREVLQSSSKTWPSTSLATAR